ncbi:MAG: DUF945 family protein [Aeromonas sp.]
MSKAKIVAVSLAGACALALGATYYTGQQFDEKLIEFKQNLPAASGLSIQEESRSLFSRQIKVRVIAPSDLVEAGVIDFEIDNHVSLLPAYISIESTLASRGVIKSIEDEIGHKLPLTMHTSSFAGRTINHRYTLAAFYLKLEESILVIKPAQGSFSYAVKDKALTGQTTWQGLTFNVPDYDVSLAVNSMTLTHNKQKVGNFWLGGDKLTLEHVDLRDADNINLTLRQLAIDTQQNLRGENISLLTDVSLGEYTQSAPMALNIQHAKLKTKFDGLDLEMLKAFAALDSLSEQQMMIVVFDVLKKGMALSVEELSAQINSAKIDANGMAQLMPSEEISLQSADFIRRLSLNAQARADKQLFADYAPMLTPLIENQFITEENEQLTSSLQIKEGALSVNGRLLMPLL